MTDLITRTIEPRTNDLGDGFVVRRVLPFHAQRMVGPFIFFDHFGPVEYAPVKGFDVRPHPHIGLATVTYLFEGAMRHMDSLGNDLVIRPGAVNWMTAGHGIVHSERTPPEERANGQSMHGLQIWVALPKSHEDVPPAFEHHAADTLPLFEKNGAEVRLLVGEAWGYASPVDFPHPILYAGIETEAGASLILPADIAEERAIYIVSGEMMIEAESYSDGQMAILTSGADVPVSFMPGAKAVLIGGAPMPERRYIDWNFVASDKDRIAQARADWMTSQAAGGAGKRFPAVPGDDGEHIPLPTP